MKQTIYIVVAVDDDKEARAVAIYNNPYNAFIGFEGLQNERSDKLSIIDIEMEINERKEER